MKARRNDFLQASSLVFAAQMLVNVMNFGFHFIVSRKIGVSAYGALNALISGMMVFSVPGVILTTIIVKYTANLHALGDEARIRLFAQRAAVFLLSIAACVLVIGFIGAPTASRYLNISDVTATILTTAIVCLNLILPLRGILQGVHRFVPYSIALVVEGLGKITLAASFVLLGWGLAGALLGWIIGSALSALYTSFILWQRYRNEGSSSFGIDFKRLAVTGAGIAGATLVVTTLGFSDVVIVKHFFNARDAGLYGAASLSGRMLYFFVNFVPAVLLPKATQARISQRSPLPILWQAMAAVMLPAALALVAFQLWPTLIVGALTGPAFISAAPLLFKYGVAMALFAILNTAVFYMIAVHHFKFVLPLAALAAIEVAAIYIYHASLFDVIQIIIWINAAGIVTVLYGVVKSNRPTAGARTAGSEGF